MIDGKILLACPEYIQLIKSILNDKLPINQLQGKTILIAGSTGLLGSCLIDLLFLIQKEYNYSFTILALGRSEARLKERFSCYSNNPNLIFVEQDVLQPVSKELEKYNPDYIFHLASNTHPVDYARKPIETLLANIEGTKNLLEYACNHKIKRFIYASSVEIYGENKSDITKFNENDFGYIDCNTLRACYPEGKRAGEALCQAYISEKNIDIVIPRFCRLFGPTMLMSDTKALSQFIKNSLNGENIVLKSEGKQFYSYLNIFDAVSALLYCLFFGKNGEAYNIADEKSDITLKELAQLIAQKSNTKVIFDLPSEIEKAGFSKATKAILDSSKLQELGWTALYNIEQGIDHTISILKEYNSK